MQPVAYVPAGEGRRNLGFFLLGVPGVGWEPGRFYAQQKPAKPRQTNKQANDDTLIDQFWKRTAELTGVK